MTSPQIQSATEAICNAQYLLITAGAGMGVDSGLPDFRGNEGFWKAYPPIAKLGLSFSQMANSQWFERDPELAWGFYGHRLNLYRRTPPHGGFSILKRWAEQKPAQVYTSNVDGKFQEAGFPEVCEVHGSILHLQCTVPCTRDIWSAADTKVEVDETTFRASGDLPRCHHCGALARPNILMFSDGGWVLKRSIQQEESLMAGLGKIDNSRLIIIELGAGTAIPSVRKFSEHFKKRGATLIRINPRESQGSEGTISIELGAKAALEQIETLLTGVDR